MARVSGDRLLQEVARRLQAAVRDEDTVARVGSDEFIVLLEEVSGEQEVLTAVRRIVPALDEPVSLDARDVTVEVGIGIALHRGGEGSEVEPSDLVRWADHAMYRAKETPGTACLTAQPGEGAGGSVRLARETDEPLRLHVNLSALQLGDPELVDRTRCILEDTGFPAERLSLEITESAAMQKPGVLDRLHDLGIELAIDDFGTRYSTLAQLRRLNIDALKIDRTFVEGLLDNEKDRAIVEAVLTLGGALGLEVIAEGIETVEQFALLRELGCDGAQGLHLGRPMPAGALRELLSPERGG